MEQKGLKKKLADNKSTVIIAATFALVVVACIFAVYPRLYTGKELWYEMFAAIIGVIITAIITMMLLVGQTDSDEKREKRGKVFEKKLQIYNEYLNTLCDVVKDGKGTDEEKLRLAFSTSAVAMHCAPERIETVSRCVKEIFRIVISKNDSKNKRLTKDEWTRQLLNNLFEVMEAFRADLYQDIKGRGQAEWKTTINNFTEAFVYNTESDEGNGSAPDTEPAAAGAATSAEEEWAEAKKKWVEDGWNVEDNLKDGDHFKLSLPGTEGYVYVGIYEGHYYVKTAWQSDPNFSKAIKWDNGGRRSYGTWWTHFDGEYFNIPLGALYERFCADEGLRKYIFGKVDYLADIVKREAVTFGWLSAVGGQEGWSLWTWYWDTLACDLLDDELGTPFFDVRSDADSGKVLITLANRAGRAEVTARIVCAIGISGLTPDADGRYTLEELNDKSTKAVAPRIKHWMEKINEAAHKIK